MFHKEGSSRLTDGKKAKDVPLRKSDRLALLQTVVETLSIPTNAPAAASLLQTVVLNDTLVKRTIKLVTANVILYIRSPSASNSSSTVHSAVVDTATTWPYTQASQCVWLSVEWLDEIHVTYQIPSLALLSVLRLASVNDTTGATATAAMAVVTIPSAVSHYLCRGAHLMRAGMRQCEGLSTVREPNATTLDSLVRREALHRRVVVAVCVQGTAQPLAVGLLHPDLTSAASSNRHVWGVGTKGIGVTIVHAYGDDIWRSQCPKVSLTQTTSVPWNRWDAGHYGNDYFYNGEWVGSATHVDEDEAPLEAASLEPGPARPTVVSETDTVDTANAGDTLPSHDIPGTDVNAVPTVVAMTPDQVLHDAVCRALASGSILKTDWPMTVATFYAQHVLPHRLDPSVTIKQTSYKKFGPYLAEQVQQGLLMVGPDPKRSKPSTTELDVLMGFNRRHEDLRPYLPKADGTDTTGATHPTPASRRRLVLADLYMVPHHFVDLLQLDRDVVKATEATSVERKGTGMLTVKEVRGILDDYVTRESLVAPASPDQVQLNGPLTDALYKKKKKAASGTAHVEIPMQLSRKDLMTRWLECQESAFALVQVPGNQILSLGRGVPPKVTIEVSKRSGNKFVTVVSGLEAYHVDPYSLAKDVSHRFACASSVSTVGSGATKPPMEVLFQGNLADELEALLLGDEGLSTHGGVKDSPYHMPQHSLDVVRRKGVPARKKRPASKK